MGKACTAADLGCTTLLTWAELRIQPAGSLSIFRQLVMGLGEGAEERMVQHSRHQDCEAS